MKYYCIEILLGEPYDPKKAGKIYFPIENFINY